MQILKKFFTHDDIVIGLSGLKKRTEYARINIPEAYKKSTIQNVKLNYLLV